MKRHRKRWRPRTGRPKKEGERTPNGRLRFVPDEGSPMLLARRALAVNPALATRGADELAKRPEARDRRASYPLGVLLLRHDISSLQHYAGRRYLGLFIHAVRGIGVSSALGRLEEGPRAPSFQATTLGEGAGDDAATTRAAYLAARRALDHARDGIADAVDATVVYEEFAPANGVGLAKLRAGLDILVEHFRSVDEGVAC